MADKFKLIFPFIAGAIIIGGTTLISQKVSTKAGSLFWAFPLSLLPVTIFLYYQTRKKQGQDVIIEYMRTSIPSMIILFLFVVTFWLTLQHWNFWTALGVSTLVWLIFAAIYWIFICPSPIGWKCFGKHPAHP